MLCKHDSINMFKLRAKVGPLIKQINLPEHLVGVFHNVYDTFKYMIASYTTDMT